MHNDTNKSGKRFTLDLFDQIHTEIITAAADDNSGFPIDPFQEFFAETTKYATMLSEIDFIIKYIQNSGRSHSESHDALHSLLDACEMDKLNPESKLFGY